MRQVISRESFLLIIYLSCCWTIGVWSVEHQHETVEPNSSEIVEEQDPDTKESLEPDASTNRKTIEDDTQFMIANMDDGVGERSASELFDELRDGGGSEGDESAYGFNKSTYDWHIDLDQAKRYNLAWRVDYPNNKIIFALGINTKLANFKPAVDIFAFGFSETGELGGSDLCLVWHDLGHQLHLQDAYIDQANRLQMIPLKRSHCSLLLDGEQQQNVGTDLAGLERLEVQFGRPLDICSDHGDRYRIDNGTTNLIWLTIEGPMGSIDGLNLTSLMGSRQTALQELDGSAPSSKRKAFEFGLKRVQLVAPKINGNHHSGGSQLELRMDRYKVPARETTYWCRLFKLPRKFETRRYHITSYEPAIEPGNEQVVHHMEVFNCANLDHSQSQQLQELYRQGGWSGPCNGRLRPQATAPCKRVVLAWAMGAHKLIYPEQVGQSIGGPSYSPFMVLEVHYNNVPVRRHLVDSSGLRFRYTSKLRPYDAGVLEVGLEYTDKNSIPPRMVTPLAGHCVGECTRAALGSGGIHVFAAQMHTHLTGVASWTEIVRGGQRIGELQRDDHYSAHFQEIRLLPEPVHVQAGDSLVHYCLYDTRQRVNITLGGFATSDEMCITYLHYYPKIELEICKSSMDSRALESYFAYLNTEELQPTSRELLELSHQFGYNENRKSVAQNYGSISWSARRSKELMQLYAAGPLSVQCIRSNGTAFAGDWQGVTPTRSVWSRKRADRPLGWQLEELEQLVAYRGAGYRSRHAQCAMSETQKLGAHQDQLACA